MLTTELYLSFATEFEIFETLSVRKGIVSDPRSKAPNWTSRVEIDELPSSPGISTALEGICWH